MADDLDAWKALAGQQGSACIATLKPGGVREPRWHPRGREMNFVISGEVRWSLVGPGGTSAGEPDDDIGLVESLSAVPPDALAAVLGAPAETFAHLPKKTDRVVIARTQGAAS